MCSICGYVNFKKEILDSDIISEMNNSLKKRGPDSNGIYIHKNVAFGHNRLSIIDEEKGYQPIILKHKGNKYVLIYNGEIYNFEEIKSDLKLKGYYFKTNSDSEVLLLGYIEYGEKILDLISGIFAFAIYDESKNEVFLCRDRLGVKPLFYSEYDNSFIFSSEIKGILAYEDFPRILSKETLLELICLGPAHKIGNTFFDNINELKPGHYLKLTNTSKEFIQYFKLEKKDIGKIKESEAVSNIKELVTSSITSQLIADKPVSTMLSGGLDSSIISAIANDKIKNLNTFSLNFKDNSTHFKGNSYQASEDTEYIEIMRNHLKSNHFNIEIENQDLFYSLKDSMISRDSPGMADIDSSMFLFCKEISKKNIKVCLSGECSDEIFGGYPWLYKDELLNLDTFAWSNSRNIRSNLINEKYAKKDEIISYINSLFEKEQKELEYLNDFEEFEKKYTITNHLTLKYFMNTLLERTDRASMAHSLEVRVPYADHKIFEYVFNLPAKLKLGLTEKNTVPTEKYLLKKAFEDILPKEVIYRKKNPFPKTYNPIYLNLVKDELLQILKNKDSKIHEVLNTNYILDLIKTDGIYLKENLFGQLMTYTQTLAYIIQIEYWLRKYNIIIKK